MLTISVTPAHRRQHLLEVVSDSGVTRLQDLGGPWPPGKLCQLDASAQRAIAHAAEGLGAAQSPQKPTHFILQEINSGLF